MASVTEKMDWLQFISHIYSQPVEGQCQPCRCSQRLPSGSERTTRSCGGWPPGFCGRLWPASLNNSMADRELKPDILRWADLHVVLWQGALFGCGTFSRGAEWGGACAHRPLEALSVLQKHTVLSFNFSPYTAFSWLTKGSVTVVCHEYTCICK